MYTRSTRIVARWMTGEPSLVLMGEGKRLSQSDAPDNEILGGDEERDRERTEIRFTIED